MDRHVKVSVIVPAYNVEDTLFDCVASLIMQTLQEIEIIIVNDCSTDHTFMCMQMLEEKFPDKLIIIDSNENRGPGGARNLGLEYASGEYIGFVDSDDYVSKDMYEKMYDEAVKTGYDIIDCGYVDEANHKSILMAGDNVTGELDANKRKQLIALGGYVWSKLFKASFILDNNLLFRENISLEDSDYISFAFATARTVGNVKEALYFYRNQPNSLSKTLNPYRYYLNCYNAMKSIYERVKDLDIYEDIREAIEYEELVLYKNIIIMSIKDGIKVQDFDILAHLNEAREWRMKNISIGYNNEFVKKYLAKEDIETMISNDNNPSILLERFKKAHSI